MICSCYKKLDKCKQSCLFSWPELGNKKDEDEFYNLVLKINEERKLDKDGKLFISRMGVLDDGDPMTNVEVKF